MTKKIMFFLTASLLSIGMLTGCSGNSGTTSGNADNNTVAQTESQADNSGNGSVSNNAASATQAPVQDTAQNTAAPDSANSPYISEEDASSIALAEVKGASASDLRIHKDTEDGRNIYEGSIWYDQTEYDFEIDAATGEIIEWSSEKKNGGSNSQNSGSSNGITEKKAIKIALGLVDGASESDLRIHKDYDDGREIYEGDIIYNEMEYDFEIDAQNGDVIEWSSESIYD